MRPQILEDLNVFFSAEMELGLKQKAVQMETLFFGLSSNDFRRLAYDFAESKGLIGWSLIFKF